MKKSCLITNDVETTSIWHNRLRDQTGERVLKEGMPKLLNLYQRYGIKSTFFFTGNIAQKFPEVVRMVLPYGQEVGCHGLTHEVDQAFDLLSYGQQCEHLRKAKDILETITGEKVISFRAPALRVNRDTARALAETGFRIDSSVSSQRFDMFLSFGSVKKLKWLISPRLPYRTQADNLFRRGAGPIVEVPVSACVMPYIGTTLRMFPAGTILLRKVLHAESLMNAKPIVFLTHPNELIREDDMLSGGVERRGGNLVSYLLGDVVRRKLKLNNLGQEAEALLSREIQFFKEKGYRFFAVKEYAKEMKLLY